MSEFRDEIVFGVIRRTKEILQNALVELEKFEKALRETPPQTFQQQPSKEDLDRLPWKSYSYGEGAWIFSDLNDPTVKSLVGLLQKSGGKVELHGYMYRFSGENNKFIARFPKKGG
jgi:hypothetical protein